MATSGRPFPSIELLAQTGLVYRDFRDRMETFHVAAYANDRRDFPAVRSRIPRERASTIRRVGEIRLYLSRGASHIYDLAVRVQARRCVRRSYMSVI